MSVISHLLYITHYLLLAFLHFLSETCKNLFPFAHCCTSRNFLYNNRDDILIPLDLLCSKILFRRAYSTVSTTRFCQAQLQPALTTTTSKSWDSIIITSVGPSIRPEKYTNLQLKQDLTNSSFYWDFTAQLQLVVKLQFKSLD